MNGELHNRERAAPDAPCVWRDSAALYVVGGLPSDDASSYREHLDSCGACAAELRLSELDVARADEALALEVLARADAPAPSPALRERLLDSLELSGRNERSDSPGKLDRSWRRWGAALPAGASTAGFASGMYAVAGDAGGWESTGIDGIEVKRLAADPERRTATMLIRMAAGTSYPAHRHGGVEECLVLSGDLQVGERELKGGDFQRCDTDSVHPVQSTRGGCLLYISSSKDDELI